MLLQDLNIVLPSPWHGLQLYHWWLHYQKVQLAERLNNGDFKSYKTLTLIFKTQYSKVAAVGQIIMLINEYLFTWSPKLSKNSMGSLCFFLNIIN